MTLNRNLGLAAAAAISLAACQKANVAENTGNAAQANAQDVAATTTKAKSSDPIESAMAAAPSSVSANATIIQTAADGSMKTLREGGNGCKSGFEHCRSPMKPVVLPAQYGGRE